MKTAIVKSKNDITQELEIEGEGVLLNCMDHRGNESFWELILKGDESRATHCRWIDNSLIKEVG